MKKFLVITLIIVSLLTGIVFAGDEEDYSSTNSINPQIQIEFSE
ncbi:hypothetical protein Marpi_0115 [Marinitoga piezophila KA3]|uniref:Uncharacterized protein n=1 Tax=Marinitoga piezophila (strain DSM 14283 / JCM 11233 / KA3) TaxID=443254 RepID=H2J354_MARPK|nr:MULTISPECIES: hypothetical protein [Marinitoga]AEX84572.1 hypothetical protein Marpi_0115 [Marinitoga piezophila KA3]